MRHLHLVALLLGLAATGPAYAQTCSELTSIIQSASDRFAQEVRDEKFNAATSDYRIEKVMSGAELCTVEDDRNTLSCDWPPMTQAEAERRNGVAIDMVRSCLPPQTKTKTFNHQRIIGRKLVFYETHENVEVSVDIFQHVPRSGAPAYWSISIQVERQ